MNTVVKILLIFWLSFISAPTIISLVADKDNHAVSLSIIEEEKETEQKFFEESYKEFLLNSDYTNLSLRVTYTKGLLYKSNDQIITVYEEIFSPPPEMV